MKDLVSHWQMLQGICRDGEEFWSQVGGVMERSDCSEKGSESEMENMSHMTN
ncbi:hypothetical protein SESBI_46121 [Sesbania bispinosa]|nr:hypothetical protein SESBI_46121 [Sesbania bispinosa]